MIAIDGGAVAVLADLVGPNLRQLDNELEKLALYAYHRTITPQDVRAMVADAGEEMIWNLTDALGQRNARGAMRALRELRRNDQNPIGLIAAIARQYRLLLQVKTLLDAGMGDRFEIAKRLGEKPFPVEKAMRLAGRYPYAEIEAILERLLEADAAMKSGADQDTEIDVVVAELTLPPAAAPAHARQPGPLTHAAHPPRADPFPQLRAPGAGFRPAVRPPAGSECAGQDEPPRSHLHAGHEQAGARPAGARDRRLARGRRAHPLCRLAAQITAGGRPVEIEIVLAPRGDGGPFVKQVKINGVPKRSMDLIGLLRAVLFLPADIELVSGAPGERRRYLDIALCQIDRAYCRALSSFQQVLTQRNSLLKLLREQDADPRAPAVEAQLAFWDERVAADGATVMARRQDFLIVLERLARLP